MGSASAARLAAMPLFGPRFATPGAALRAVQVMEGGQEVSAETRALELGPAAGMEPAVDAGQTQATAVDDPVTLDAEGPGGWLALAARRAVNGRPVGGEGVTAPSAAARGNSHHVNWPARHAGVVY